MRLFVGLPLPVPAVEFLETVQAGLDLGRPVAPENLHVTLAFLDEQPEAVAEAVHDGLKGLAAPGFEIRLDGVEAKGRGRVKLVWARVAGPPPELLALRASVRAVVRGAGVDLPRERFRPHVTLARFGARGADPARLAPWLSQVAGLGAGPFAIDHVCLYRSTLTAEGPLYDGLAQYPLA